MTLARCRYCRRSFTTTPERQDVCSASCATELLHVEVDEVAGLFASLLGIERIVEKPVRSRRRITSHINPANTKARGAR